MEGKQKIHMDGGMHRHMYGFEAMHKRIAHTKTIFSDSLFDSHARLKFTFSS
jgi:hypothetical protein